MLRLQGQAQHSDTLEWIIIILVGGRAGAAVGPVSSCC